jgi:hypothetical protein
VRPVGRGSLYPLDHRLPTAPSLIQVNLCPDSLKEHARRKLADVSRLPISAGLRPSWCNVQTCRFRGESRSNTSGGICSIPAPSDALGGLADSSLALWDAKSAGAPRLLDEIRENEAEAARIGAGRPAVPPAGDVARIVAKLVEETGMTEREAWSAIFRVPGVHDAYREETRLA